MPYHVKDGIDFDRVYAELIGVSLRAVGFEVFRADQEMRAGSILADMFQELLLADLVIADLSIDNPNVWYELGVRHALQPAGVILVQGKRDYMPFDLYTDRTLRYHLKDGAPDPAFLEQDRAALATFVDETRNAWRGRKVSPVYHLLESLQPPDWKSLRVGPLGEYWEMLDEWESRIRVAQKEKRVGDILVLAEEAPAHVLRVEAYRAAAQALQQLQEFHFAFAQCEKALEIDPDDLPSERLKGILLGRLHRYAEAEEWLRNVIRKHPTDGEAWGLLGRVEKNAWLRSWQRDGASPQQMREDAAAEIARLDEAIQAYRKGFRLDPGKCYPGINALTLMYLREHLTGEQPDPKERLALEGAVLWAIQATLEENPRDYWARATLGDWELLTGRDEDIREAYRRAIAVGSQNYFDLDSTRQAIQILKTLGFRPSEVDGADLLFTRSLARLGGPTEPAPGKVFLFTGHMIDKPDRNSPRFPPGEQTEKAAAEAISAKLDELGAGREDLAFCSAACGGDLLFAQECLRKGLSVRIRIPFEEPQFLEESVNFAGDHWQRLYFEVTRHPQAVVLVMPEKLGDTPRRVDPFARNNLWMMYTALAWGPAKVRFICLWDRQAGDGPGGTKHMYDMVRRYFGQVHVLDTHTLW